MAFDSFFAPLPLKRLAAARAGFRPSGSTAIGAAGFVVHDEEAFRHFLSIEWKRADRAQRGLFLVLVRFGNGANRGARLTPHMESQLFAGLGRAVREIDFIGWYRQKRVAGGVLVQGAEPAGADAKQRIAKRVAREVGGALPPDVAGRLRVRVVALRPVIKPWRFPE